VNTCTAALLMAWKKALLSGEDERLLVFRYNKSGCKFSGY